MPEPQTAVEASRVAPLAGRKGLVTGIANDQSIAWGGAPLKPGRRAKIIASRDIIAPQTRSISMLPPYAVRRSN
jgi:hypothetical protein